jgi:prepilin peptidase CpaA
VAIAGAIASAVIDLRTRRIPNLVTMPLAALGFGLAATGTTGSTMGTALLGSLVGLSLMLPGHLLGGSGAGDVKLVAALGTLLGPSRVVFVFLYSAIAGGVLAIAVASARGRLNGTFQRTARLVTSPVAGRKVIDGSGANNRFCYGPAIAAGTLLAALGF